MSNRYCHCHLKEALAICSVVSTVKTVIRLYGCQANLSLRWAQSQKSALKFLFSDSIGDNKFNLISFLVEEASIPALKYWLVCCCSLPFHSSNLSLYIVHTFVNQFVFASDLFSPSLLARKRYVY